ncbi:MAG TPA: SRPBCC family protein [Candidatus Acidoferrales bacterium]|nr:SRPBCC family protein [Candidatus Acidoferrales bacterium]
MDDVWAFGHTVECDVSAEFAWKFWTNVENWKLDSDVVSVELQGPFAIGARGATQTKSSGRLEWRVADLGPGRAVLEFPAPGAVARFAYTFEDAAGGRTRITQRVSLSGEKASMYVDTIAHALEAGIPEGMRKLCEAMEAAAGKSSSTAHE